MMNSLISHLVMLAGLLLHQALPPLGLSQELGSCLSLDVGLCHLSGCCLGLLLCNLPALQYKCVWNVHRADQFTSCQFIIRSIHL